MKIVDPTTIDVRPKRLPRIAIGGIMHETNTFATNPTTLADFAQRSLLRGAEVIEAGTGSHSALGGVIASARDTATLLPTLFASAMPGGKVEKATFAHLSNDLLNRLRIAHEPYPRLDGVVLVLHGAMATDSDDDPEGTLLRNVRDLVGRSCPVVAVVDSHANLGHDMVHCADLVIGYRSYPHIDTFARGFEALGACLGMIRSGSRPVMASRKLPLLMPLIAQATDVGDVMTPVLQRAEHWRSQPGVVSISLIPGFPFADVPDAGATAIAATRAESAISAEDIADDLASVWWNERDNFHLTAMPIEHLPLDSETGVTVIADIADNPGAGAPSDGTHVLRHFLDRQIGNAAFATIVDPEAVAECWQVGIGVIAEIGIGGKAGPKSGQPIIGPWEVIHLGEGVFSNEGPMSKGATTRIGRTATVRLHGISVILSEHRAQALDPSVFRAGGIVPEHCRWLVVKSSVHYRAAFRTMATAMIDVECPGLSSSDLLAFTYNRVRRPLAPLDTMDASSVASALPRRLHA